MLYAESARQATKSRSMRWRIVAQLQTTCGCLALLGFILFAAATTSYLVVDPIAHPSRHPTIVRFERYMAHYHPRLSKLATAAPLVAIISAELGVALLAGFSRYRVRRRGTLRGGDPRSDRLLNQPIADRLNLVLPSAWERLKDFLPGLYIKIPDLRGAHWQLLEENDNRHQMRLALQYVRDPIGLKPWRLYPRTIYCTINLKGKGAHSLIDLRYTADSAMDYENVYPIIEKTNAAIKSVMSDV